MGWELDPDLDPPGSRTLKIRSWIRNKSFRIHTTVGNTVNKGFLTHANISTICEHTCGPVRLQLTKPGEKIHATSSVYQPICKGENVTSSS